MATQQWEYCELGLVEWKAERREDELAISSYECYIRYYRATGADYHPLTTLERPVPYNPFTRALALLGEAGWELITVQHGVKTGGGAGMQREGLLWDNRVAYLKRPLMPGRAIDEPPLVV